MDLVWLAAFIVVIAMAFYAIERVPFPANPPWLKRGLEAFVAIAICLTLLQRLGVPMPHL